MNTTEIEPRRSNETLVIAKSDTGYRVCSPSEPGRQFVVSDIPDDPQCTCPDFTHPGRPAEWQCKHIAAVLKEVAGKSEPQSNGAPHSNGGRGAGELPEAGSKKTPAGRNDAVMLLRRSVSPDGRIDSLSVEFSCPVASVTTGEIRQQAERILMLQGEIAAGFLKNGNGNGHANGNGSRQPAPSERNGASDAVRGQMLEVASMPGRWGRRLFINVMVNEKVLKLFGSERQLAEAVAAAGFPDMARALADGTTLNLPCRVVTKPSPDGRYVNVERVYPAENGAR